MGMTSYQCNLTPSHSNHLTSIEKKYDTFADDLSGAENFSCCGTWAQITAPAQADAPTTSVLDIEYEDDMQYDALSSIPPNEKKFKQSERYFSHSLDGHKAPQLVAKRNLRERNRVQAVNGAFNRLRKAVPFQHARGKRISKVKTLQNAINYIRGLEQLLNNEFMQTISIRRYFNPKEDSIWWDLEY
ncbi:achaete-scute complex protein T3-like [Coccinella septempunctata]|uniref:achaete-scute complex protein T3-like n=1 Tax=Coccinella septempunctata TaxID=41139 RepID=UPI001D08A894|nr:achaete-scute complex protein T3-like [Coccinella septempunctata]